MIVTAVGLMSGTSLDGIDAAILRTDGKAIVERYSRSGTTWLTVPYSTELRGRLREWLNTRKPDPDLERELTVAHADAVKKLVAAAKLQLRDVDVIGFHGQTIFHDPENGKTWQAGDGELLSQLCEGTRVVYDFRSEDVRCGGQGAPLAPAYHWALAQASNTSNNGGMAIVNIGGVSNITIVPQNAAEDALIAFDTGPGNALLDDFVLSCSGGDTPFDANGEIASRGTVDEAILSAWIRDPYFSAAYPKSLDRDHFQKLVTTALSGLSLEDGAATLTAFTAHAIAVSVRLLQRNNVEVPVSWFVTGGGRHNATMMSFLQRALCHYSGRNNFHVLAVEAPPLSAEGDALEAEAFAYLAVRVLRHQPTSWPGTTGCKEPVCSGKVVGSGALL